jgi:hypothetical protein
MYDLYGTFLALSYNITFLNRQFKKRRSGMTKHNCVLVGNDFEITDENFDSENDEETTIQEIKNLDDFKIFEFKEYPEKIL